MHPGTAIAIASVRREIEQMQAAEAAVADGLSGRGRRAAGPSVVFSLRLDTGEMAALERRAAVLGVKPSVLARNLVRNGLSHRTEDDLSKALTHLRVAVDEVRALLA
jgi:hypothetical protein